MIPKIPGLSFGGGFEESSSDQLSNASTQNAGSTARGSMLNLRFDSGVNFAPKGAPAWQWIASAIAVAVVGVLVVRAMSRKGKK